MGWGRVFFSWLKQGKTKEEVVFPCVDSCWLPCRTRGLSTEWLCLGSDLHEASGPSENGSLDALLRQKMVFSRAAEWIGVWGHLDPFWNIRCYGIEGPEWKEPALFFLPNDKKFEFNVKTMQCFQVRKKRNCDGFWQGSSRIPRAASPWGGEHGRASRQFFKGSTAT